MNTAKHTQGPWAVDHAFGVGPISASDDQSYGMVLAVADTYGDNRVADSRLIAAAPELLEALRGMVALEEENLRSGDDIDVCFELESARAAIAKATGAESSAAEIGAAAKKGTPQPQTQHNKTPQNVLITTDQKFTQTQQKQSKNKL